MSDFLLPEEEGRMKGDALRPSPVTGSPFLLPGERTAAERAEPVLRTALTTDPDAEATTQRIARAAGLPSAVAGRNMDRAKLEARLVELQAATKDANPALLRRLSDEQFAKIAHDDIDNLSRIGGVVGPQTKPWVTSAEFSERVQDLKKRNPTMGWDEARTAAMQSVAGVNDQRQNVGPVAPANTFANQVQSVVAGLPINAERVLQGVRSQFADATGNVDMAFDARERRRQLDIDTLLTTPKMSSTEKGIASGVSSFAEQLPGLALSVLTANPIPALAWIAATSQTRAYGKYRDRGASGGEAALAATGEAAVEVGTELLPMRFLTSQFGKMGVGSFLRGLLGREIPGEQVATFLQDAIDTAVANPNKTWKEFFAERPEAGYETLLATITQGGVMGALNKGMQLVERKEAEATTAENDAQALQGLSELVASNKVLERDASSLQAYIDEAAEEGPVREVFVPASVFAQAAGENLDVFKQLMPSVAEQFDDALAANTDLVIPLGEFIVQVQGTGMEAALIDHIRTGVDAPSRAEAQEYMQSGAAEELRKTIEQQMERAVTTTEEQASAAKVEADLLAQLKEANRFTEDVNALYARATTAFYAATAKRLAASGKPEYAGMTAEKLAKQYRLNVAAETPDAGGSALEQQVDLNTPEFKAWFGDSKVVDSAGKPLVVYHGGPKGITAFDPARVGKNFGYDKEGFFFTTEKSNIPGGAANYAGEEGEVYPVYLNIKNPYTLAQYAADIGDALDRLMYYGGDAQSPIAIFDDNREEIIANAKAGGHDGIAFDYKYDEEFSEGLFVAFRPEQIKSVFNNRPTDDPNILKQSATIRRGSETLRKYGLNPDGRYTTREVAAALEARQRVKYGVIDKGDRSPEASSKIAKWMVEEILFEMQHPQKSGVGWYSEKFQRALDTYAQKFPELADDQQARDLFTLAIAVTSDGVKARDNFNMAADVYGRYRAGEGFHLDKRITQHPAIARHTEKLNDLVAKIGADKLRDYLLQEVPVGEINKMLRAEGQPVYGDYTADTLMPLSAVLLGPKIGVFAANLLGSHGYLTMDRWWSRTFNRYRGTLLTTPTPSSFVRVRELLGAPSLSDDEVLAAAAEHRASYEAKGYKDGTELEKAANTMYKLAFENINDVPFNARDRSFMIESVNKAQKNLKRRGIEMSIADIQAALWYYEKRLYGELGARQSDVISYEDAARQAVAGAGESGDLFGGPDAAGDQQAAVEQSAESVPGDELFENGDAVPGESVFNQGGLIPEPLREVANPTPKATLADFSKGGVGSILARTDWTILTAANPDAVQLDEIDNAARMDALRARLDELGFEHADVQGKYGNEEPSIVVTGITREQALALGREFGQQSVLTRDGLVYKDGAVNPARKVEVFDTAPEDFYTKLPDGTTFAIDIDFDRTVTAPDDGRRAGEVTVAGVHFSAEGRTTLNTAMYGKGMKDAGAAATLASPDARLHKRGFFYVNEGEGLRAEKYVGTVAHVATLTNLYDVKADPLGIWGKGGTQGESAVLDAGFDGYYSRGQFSLGLEKVQGNEWREKTMGAVVVLDKRSIPVTRVGSERDAIAITQPRTFQQAEREGTRGMISFGADISAQPSTITLLKNADLSTFLHELGHFQLEVLANIAGQPNAPAEIVDDLNRILKWFGVGDAAAWNAMSLEQKRPYHEQFARGFEAYLFEGKAPAVELRGAFSRIRAWMTAVYREITALDVNLTDEVRGVFDRLVASEQQIKEAEAARAFAPLFKSAEEMGATTEEWAEYQAQAAEATEDAVASLQSASLRDMRWLSNARSRTLRALQKDAAAKRKSVEAEVRAEVEQQPVYAAARWLKTGVLPDGTQTVGAKLDLAALKEFYGENPAAAWRYLATGTQGLAGNEGLHPDQVAEMFGFSSGDHLVRELLAAEPEASVVEGMTDQRMLERYGDLATPQALERAVDDALHNEARARFISTELRALTRATGNQRAMTKAAKDFAAQIIARKKVRDVKPAQFTAAEARAGRAAEKAKGLTEKATEKRNQLVNHYAARAAHEALSDVEKGLALFKRTVESEAIDIGYREQIDALLERFDLRSGQSLKAIDKRTALAEWIKSQEDMGFEPTISEELRNEAFRKSYKDMTVEEFRGLVDAVKNIEHLGRLKKKLLTIAGAREFAAVVDELRESIEANATGTVAERRASDRGPLVQVGKLFRNFLADHRKFASLAREMDGWKDGGRMWDYLVRSMNAAGDKEAVMREQATVKLSALMAPILKQGGLGKKTFFDKAGKSFTREEVLGIALNMGNLVNRERVTTGENLSPAALADVLDSLSKQDWDFVQGVLDYLETFRTEIAAKERRLTGTEPEWVEAAPINTKFGVYRGGYYPITHDPERSTRAEADTASEVQRQLERGLYTRAQTRRGHLKARIESTGRPLRYDLGVIVGHVDQVVHDLSWHEYLIDANRVLRALDIPLREYYGPEKLRAMKETLTDIAVGDLAAKTSGDRILNHLRHSATVAGLGWRVTTSLLQPLGLTQSAVRIGSKWVLKGAYHWMGDAFRLENSVRLVGEKSDFMRLRAKTMQREINEIRNKVAGQDSRIEASYFLLIQKMQLVADLPTWWGQYEKTMAEEGATEAGAIAMADQAVRDAQGGGQIGDLAGVQRGSAAWRLFTNFYSFFNTTYNLTRESFGRTKSAADVPALAVDLLLLYSVPALLGTLMKAALADDWDDEDKLLRRLAADQLNYLFGTIVVVREINAAVQSAAGLAGDYGGPASVRLFNDLAKLAKQTEQGEADEGFWKALNSVGGDILGYPAGQINATASGLHALATGRTDNPGALLVGAQGK